MTTTLLKETQHRLQLGSWMLRNHVTLDVALLVELLAADSAAVCRLLAAVELPVQPQPVVCGVGVAAVVALVHGAARVDAVCDCKPRTGVLYDLLVRHEY